MQWIFDLHKRGLKISKCLYRRNFCITEDGIFFNDLLFTETADSCYSSCVGTADCMGYTWYKESLTLPNYCFLYSDCSSTAPCQECRSGVLNCLDQSASTTTGPPVPTQCANDLVMENATRNEDNGYGVYCDDENYDPSFASIDWQGAEYYRLLDPAGVRISTTAPLKLNHCGTEYPG